MNLFNLLKKKKKNFKRLVLHFRHNILINTNKNIKFFFYQNQVKLFL